MLNRFVFSVPVVGLALCVSSAVQAQQATNEVQPAFETASIRPSHVTLDCFSILPPGGTHYEIGCMPLRILIQIAYKTSYIEGGGSGLDTAYDLRATTPDGKPWTDETIRPMMQQFLAERFHLVAHPGKRILSGYGLFLAKGEPKLHSLAKDTMIPIRKSGEPSQNFITSGHIQARGMDSAGIAGLVSVALRVPVIDHTGLSGRFNIDLEYAPDDVTESNFPSFFPALEEELGLKLEPEKVTVDTLVIDHVDIAPTPN